MLFVIDMQNDFVDQEKGLMAVEGADTLVEGIIQEIRRQEEQGEPVYYTLNQHQDEDDGRSDAEKAWGMEIYASLKDVLAPHKALKKDFHSIAPEQGAEMKKQYDDDPDRIISFVGVETNVCVLSNAIVLHNVFPLATIRVIEDLCKGSNEKLHQETLDILKSLKIEVTGQG